VIVTFYKSDDISGRKGWIELTMDESLKIEVDSLEKSLDFVRSNFMPESKVNISLEYGTAIFATGQDFLDWVAEKKKSLQDFKEGEIVQ